VKFEGRLDAGAGQPRLRVGARSEFPPLLCLLIKVFRTVGISSCEHLNVCLLKWIENLFRQGAIQLNHHIMISRENKKVSELNGLK